MEVKRVHLIVTGRVQGVSFRAYTQREASSLGLVGWVRNLPTRQVEIVAEGSAEAIAEFLQWAHEGPSLARVDRVDVDFEPPTGEFADFTVR